MRRLVTGEEPSRTEATPGVDFVPVCPMSGRVINRTVGSKLLVLCLLVSLILISCAATPEVSREELTEKIESEAEGFPDLELPPEILQDLATHRVLVLGETHRLREHWALLAGLLEQLNDVGSRQLMIEAPHMAEWLLNDYVQGGVLAPDWDPPAFYEKRLTAIRDLNQELTPERRVRLQAIDVNEVHHGGGQAFRDVLARLAESLGETGAVEAFVDTAPGTFEDERKSLEELSDELSSQSSELGEAWGPEWYDHVLEMVEVERASIDIREYRESDDDRAARHREEEIKELVESRLAGYEGGSVINVGAHHAQKSPLMGTDQEWLGDYLANRSEAADGSVFIIGFTAAETVLEPGAPGSPFDIVQSSPEDELLRLMAEVWPDLNVYLPLDDPLFSERRVAYNSENVIYAVRLADIFDALFQYGVAHRMADS